MKDLGANIPVAVWRPGAPMQPLQRPVPVTPAFQHKRAILHSGNARLPPSHAVPLKAHTPGPPGKGHGGQHWRSWAQGTPGIAAKLAVPWTWWVLGSSLSHLHSKNTSCFKIRDTVWERERESCSQHTVWLGKLMKDFYICLVHRISKLWCLCQSGKQSEQ